MHINICEGYIGCVREQTTEDESRKVHTSQYYTHLPQMDSSILICEHAKKGTY